MLAPFTLQHCKAMCCFAAPFWLAMQPKSLPAAWKDTPENDPRYYSLIDLYQWCSRVQYARVHSSRVLSSSPNPWGSSLCPSMSTQHPSSSLSPSTQSRVHRPSVKVWVQFEYDQSSAFTILQVTTIINLYIIHTVAEVKQLEKF